MDKRVKIFVFKTNLQTMERITSVGIILDEQPGILRWNVDHWDVDNILRIEAHETSTATEIMEMIRKVGFDCDELPD